MSNSAATHKEDRMALAAVAYAFALFAIWSAAWLLSLWLEEKGILRGDPLTRFLYWLVLRILFWVLPSLAIIRRCGRPLRDVLGFHRIREILLWGGIIGLLWGGKSVILRMITHQPIHPAVLDWSFVTAVLYAPLVEEITFRGAIIGALEMRMKFFWANIINGFLFLLIHLPGWYFQGMLVLGSTNFLSSALGILLLGWIFGYVARRSRSIAASTLAHMLNNLFQRFVN